MSTNPCVCSLNAPVTKEGTCMPSAVIDTIMKIEKIDITPYKTPVEKIEALSNKLECGEKNKELCILSKAKIQNTIKMKLDQAYFKPFAESHHTDYWLNNTEIDACLRQFQLQHKNFAYSFIHMSDLKMFPPNNKEVLPHPIYPVTEIDFGAEFMGTSSPRKLFTEQPLRYYGVVFNTDTSDKSGQHWFCVFIEFDKKKGCTIELFNSSGEDIDSTEFNAFWLKTQLDIQKKTGVPTTFKKVSNIQHQDPSTGSCGAYSLFYIYSRLQGIPAEEFDNKKRKVHDEEMTRFRKFLFRTNTIIDAASSPYTL